MQLKVKQVASQKTHWCIIQMSIVWMKGKWFDIVVRSESCVFISANSLVIKINITCSWYFKALIGLCCHTTRSLQQAHINELKKTSRH